MEGVTQQDKAIAGEAVKERKPIVVVVNKWDLVHEGLRSGRGECPGYQTEREYRENYERALFDRLFFTPGAPLVFVSAMSGYEVDRMLNAAVKLNRTLDKKLPTAKLNQTLAHLAERTPPPVHRRAPLPDLLRDADRTPALPHPDFLQPRGAADGELPAATLRRAW